MDVSMITALATRMARLEPSPIREILSVIDRPGMISLAGGLPSQETFPVMDLSRMPPSYLQYGPTEGDPALRQQISQELQALGLDCPADQVLVLSGSQQGIDLVAKLFIDTGTPVAVERPTYLAALQAFRLFGARFVPLDHEQPGATLLSHGRPAFAYSIPTFQNPAGYCLDANERDALAEACDNHRVPLFEDDPYRDLVYEPCERKPVCARLRRAPWIYQGSFSKSLAPGLRLGYLAASPELFVHLVRLKQAADLHSNRISQWLVLEQLRSPDRPRRLASLQAHYRRRRDAFAGALEKHFGASAQWQIPRGGLFFWLSLHEVLDTRRLLPEAIERGVAFMPGEPFFAEQPSACGALRLNFSHASEAQIETGLAILAQLTAG